MSKFELGRLVATTSVADRMKTDYAFNHFVYASLTRFRNGDWGEVDAKDKALFDANLEEGQGALQGVYTEPKSIITIWIFTEWDHSTTTVLFPYEW